MAIRLALLLALVLALAAPHALAECTTARWTAHSLTTLSTTFPRTGAALVVAMDADVTGGTLATPSPDGVNVTRGRRIMHPLAGVAIAPGLFRVPFDAHMTRGPWVLHGLGPDATLTVGMGAMPGAPVRPSVRHMRRVSVAGLGSTVVQRIEVRADLEFPVPEGIVASIITWNTDAAPSAWNRVSQGQTEIVAYTTPSRCAASAPGWAPPPDGTLIARIAWVDRFGQVSPVSDATSVD
jgi:hypothetical protein